MSANEEYELLSEWLKLRGHSDEEIQTIMDHVRQYEQETQLDSVMDSIGSGRMTLDGLVKEALKDR